MAPTKIRPLIITDLPQIYPQKVHLLNDHGEHQIWSFNGDQYVAFFSYTSRPIRYCCYNRN